MPNQRPTAVLVIAIFHFIVGGLGLMCDLCGAASLAGGGAPGFPGQQDPKQTKMQKDMEATLKREIPAYQAVLTAKMALAFAFDVALICAGIGLLQMASWGRALSLAYATVSLTVKVGLAFYAIMYELPALDKAMEGLMSQVQTAQERKIVEFASTFAKGAVFGGACLAMIYPAVVLLVMNLQSVKDAFSGQAPGPEGDEGWYRRGPAAPPPDAPRPGDDDRYTPR